MTVQLSPAVVAECDSVEIRLGDNQAYVRKSLYDLSMRLGKRYPERQVHGALGGDWGYGQDFKNEVFEMHPQYYDGCTCGFHTRERLWLGEHVHAGSCGLDPGEPCSCGVEDAYREWRKGNNHDSNCRLIIPNFKCGDVEITWYKYIGRDMTVNRPVARDELKQIFKKCRRSLR